MKNPKLTSKAINAIVRNINTLQWSSQRIASYFYNLGIKHGQEYVKYLEEQKKLDDIW